MMIAFHRLFNPKVVHDLRVITRSLYTSRILRDGAYDGPGKTTVTILNKSEDSVLMINSYDSAGFHLNNGIRTIGPLIIFPRSLLYWNITCGKDINKDSLIMFDILEPKIDLLIIGLETTYDYKFILSLKELLKNLGVKNEIYPVDQACTTFNFVASEGRYAAAALIPPERVLGGSLSLYRQHLKNVIKENNDTKLIDDKK